MNKFDRFFSRFSRRMDEFIFRAVLALFILLIISQALLSNSSLRSFISQVDRLEGQAVDLSEQPVNPEIVPTGGDQYQPMVITLTIEGEANPDVKVLVDGQVVGSFSEREVIISPAPGQCIEVDATAVQENVSVYVSHTTSSVEAPTVGYKVVAYGTNELIGYAVPQN